MHMKLDNFGQYEGLNMLVLLDIKDVYKMIFTY